MYIRENFRCTEIQLDCDLESLGVNIILSPRMNFTVIVLYNPPSHDVTFYDELKKLLTMANRSSECILLGDFNVNWMDKVAKQKLKALTAKFNYHQLIDKPTRITKREEGGCWSDWDRT